MVVTELQSAKACRRPACQNEVEQELKVEHGERADETLA